MQLWRDRTQYCAACAYRRACVHVQDGGGPLAPPPLAAAPLDTGATRPRPRLALLLPRTAGVMAAVPQDGAAGAAGAADDDGVAQLKEITDYFKFSVYPDATYRGTVRPLSVVLARCSACCGWVGR